MNISEMKKIGDKVDPDRITKPMIRAKISDPWREVSWDEALAHTAREFRRIQQKHGTNAIGAIVSSRCTNEEDYLVQKLVRTAFGNNNVDTCVRVAKVCASVFGEKVVSTTADICMYANAYGRATKQRKAI